MPKKKMPTQDIGFIRFTGEGYDLAIRPKSVEIDMKISESYLFGVPLPGPAHADIRVQTSEASGNLATALMGQLFYFELHTSGRTLSGKAYLTSARTYRGVDAQLKAVLDGPLIRRSESSAHN